MMSERDGTTLWRRARGDLPNWRAIIFVCTMLAMVLLAILYFGARSFGSSSGPTWALDETFLLCYLTFGAIGIGWPKRNDVLAWGVRVLLLLVCLAGSVLVVGNAFSGGLLPTPFALIALASLLAMFSIVRQGRLRS